MSSDLKREYLKITKKRYLKASKWEKKWILNEFCQTTGLYRKSAIRLLNRDTELKKRPGRKIIYAEETIRFLRRLWIQMNQMCSKNMKAALPLWLPFFDCPEETKTQLLAMSAATIDRKLKPFRSEIKRRSHSGTRPGYLRHVIPIKPLDFNVSGPGFVEADTVAHCGGSLSGEFIWSLTFTDVYSGWTENRAVFSKASYGVLEALKDIEDKIPFSILAFNCDNGSEFLNHQLIRYFGPHGDKKRLNQLMTRSREYRKNDNCHVEQKNWTHVRELFGYDRFSDKKLVDIMNGIYKNEHNLLHNFFIPQMKLKTKLRTGAKYKRTYTKPQTPYQRLIECPGTPEDIKAKLTATLTGLNPFELRKKMQKKLKVFYKALTPDSDQIAEAA